MTREEVVALVRQAVQIDVGYNTWTISTPHLEEFARLVAAAEREACAKVCDDIWQTDGSAYDCREAIRARGETK